MSYRAWIGIDPGKEGAIARVYESGEVDIFDAPIAQTDRKSEYDPVEMARLVRKLMDDSRDGLLLPHNVLVVLEKVNAMPSIPGPGGVRRGMGVASAFSFGEGAGLWRGVVCAIGCPILRPAPVSWKKKVMSDVARGKEASVPVASSLYPACAAMLRTPRGRLLTGRADAVLLAHFGRVYGNG